MSDERTPLYPLKFAPIYLEKVWGGRELAQLGRNLPGDERTLIGESWEIADLDSTAPSGGGGAEMRSVIANGALAGLTLHQAIERFGPRLLGRLPPTAACGFPLLVKYLDARQNLSVQTHPSEAYARTHTDAHLKSEAWYILDAQPGAVIYKGLREGITAEELREAVLSRQVERVEALLIRVPAKAGDCHYLPSGTCHAMGAGIVAAEIQTPSDTTFRLFDWQRTDRPLHLEQALQCVRFGPPEVRLAEKRSHIAGLFTTVSKLVSCEHFRIERVRMSEDYEQEIPYNEPAVWMVLSGRGRVDPGNGAPPVTFQRGETMLLPANLDQAKLHLDQDTVWLETTFPQARPDQIA